MKGKPSAPSPDAMVAPDQGLHKKAKIEDDEKCVESSPPPPASSGVCGEPAQRPCSLQVPVYYPNILFMYI